MNQPQNDQEDATKVKILVIETVVVVSIRAPVDKKDTKEEPKNNQDVANSGLYSQAWKWFVFINFLYISKVPTWNENPYKTCKPNGKYRLIKTLLLFSPDFRSICKQKVYNQNCKDEETGFGIKIYPEK